MLLLLSGFFFVFIKSENPVSSIFSTDKESDLSYLFQKNHFLPLSIMLFSLFAVLLFYIIHIKRILKEITNSNPNLDFADNEAKIEFTIAERRSSKV